MTRLHALAPYLCQLAICLASIGCALEDDRPRSPRSAPEDDTGGSGGATGGSGGKKGGGSGTGGAGGMMSASKDAGRGPEPSADAAGMPPPSDAKVADAPGSTDVLAQPSAPKLSKDVVPVLKTRCALAGCHDPRKKEHGMDLSTAATVFPAWVNKVTADHCKNNAAVTRVVPFKPDESFVVTLISAVPGRCAEVRRMPPPALPQLPAAEVKIIRDWVAAGALDD